MPARRGAGCVCEPRPQPGRIFTTDLASAAAHAQSCKVPAACTCGPSKAQSDHVQGKGGRVRVKQGSLQEETALRQHLRQLGPSPENLLQCSHLAELLMVLGDFGAAQRLQHALGSQQAAHAEAAAWLSRHPPAEDAAQPQQGAKQPAAAEWKWHILSDVRTA